MSKKVIAIENGFHHSIRIKEGQRFTVGDNETGKWFVLEKDYKPKRKKTMADVATLSEAARRKAMSFTELMASEKESDQEPSQKASDGRQSDKPVV